MIRAEIINSDSSFPPADEEFMKQFVRNAPTAVVLFDKAWRFLAMSSRFNSTYGLENIDFEGIHSDELFPDIPEEWREVHR